jgi:hypothetical protein
MIPRLAVWQCIERHFGENILKVVKLHGDQFTE